MLNYVKNEAILASSIKLAPVKIRKFANFLKVQKNRLIGSRRRNLGLRLNISGNPYASFYRDKL